MGDRELINIFDNLKQLCTHECGSLPPELIKKSIARSVVHLSQLTRQNQKDATPEFDDCSLSRKIEFQLAVLNKQNDVPKLHQLLRALRRNEFDPLQKNKNAVLIFLLKLSELEHKSKEREPFILNHSLTTLRHKNHSFTSLSKVSTERKPLVASRVISPSSESSLSFQSVNSSSRFSNSIDHDFIQKITSREKSKSSTKDKRTNESVPRCYSADSFSQIASNSVQKRITTYDTNLVSEAEIVKELSYCFQGLPGSVIKLDHTGGFTIDPQVKVPYPDLVLKLMEIGYLHNNIVNKSKMLLKNGAVLRAIESAIRKLLKEYYKVIACIQSEFVEPSDCQAESSREGNKKHRITLARLFFNVSQTFGTLKTICDVINAIQNTKGGAALTALYPMRFHGDPRYSTILDDIVTHAERPLMNMMCTWMVEGELCDPHDEFFIAINTECHDRDIWRNKFILRSALMPNIISENQASMILRSGKAIKFLTVICEERIPVVGMREKLKRMKDANISDLRNPRSELTDLVAAVTDETSKLVLDTLVDKFKLFEHFQGLRRYMLLGQGDFVNYFMDLVEPQMRKPASKLQYYELMSLLGTAIRGSNAAFEDPDVINRVTVKLLVASGGDWGSDVFGLQYLMHDTLDAALRISEGAYSQVFNFLWRTKRMESILLRLRKERWATKNYLNLLARKFPDINGVIMCADKLNLEFLHFARQFHYYILFEVVECLWEKFLQEYKKARSFDEVIKAHDSFIKLIQTKTFHRDESRVFINQFRLIWDLVYELESLEEMFFNRVVNECEYYSERKKKIELHGTSHNEEAQNYLKKREFKSFLDSVRAQYDIINRNYQGVLKKFLLALSSESSNELVVLSDRIDFNDYYKKGDSRITDSMKYSFCNELLP
ncbi:gamma-tubulin complex component 3-like [Rhodnius prolixus]